MTAASDLFPKQIRKRRAFFTMSTCIVCFFLAIPCVTQVNNFAVSVIVLEAVFFLMFLERVNSNVLTRTSTSNPYSKIARYNWN